MARDIVWIQDPEAPGWGCSNCPWKFPVPTLLSDPEAKKAYDRLATSKFQSHICERTSSATTRPREANEPTFTDRIRKLVKVGYKPKDAVTIALDELSLEYRGDAAVMRRAQAEAEDFLRKVRDGLI